MGIIVNTAILRSQFWLRGGWKSFLNLPLLYGALMSGLILLTMRVEPRKADQILYFWTQGLLAFQTGTLLILAGSAISNAIRKDITTRMLESHRLMPISGYSAVSGYMFGPLSQTAGISLVHLLLGIATAGASGGTIGGWVLANAVLASYAVCFWTAVALFSLLSTSAMALAVIFLIVCWINLGTPLTFLPGLGMISSPLAGEPIYTMVERGPRWSAVQSVAVVEQFALAGLFVVAAARRYRRDDVLAFGPVLGFALVAFWILASATGIAHADAFGGGFKREIEMGTQVVASTLAALLLALVPLSSSVWLEAQWRRRQSLRDPTLPARPLPTELIIVELVILILLLPVCAAGYLFFSPVAVLLTAIAVAAFLVATRSLMQIMYRIGSKARLIVMLYVGVFWFLPVLIDAVRFGVVAGERGPLLTEISGCSPIGTLAFLWNDLGKPQAQAVDPTAVVAPGLLVQFVVAAGLAVLARPGKARRHEERQGRAAG